MDQRGLEARESGSTFKFNCPRRKIARAVPVRFAFPSGQAIDPGSGPDRCRSGPIRPLRLHIRATHSNGVTRKELNELLLQSAIYCGVPAANSAFHAAQEVFDEMDREARGETRAMRDFYRESWEGSAPFAQTIHGLRRVRP